MASDPNVPGVDTSPVSGSAASAGTGAGAVDALVQSYAAGPRSSARTLLATIFGDSIEAHGGTIWLGSLIELVEPLEISERLVRTSIHRLVLEGFLVATQVGRRSYYTVTESARRDFRNAERRIYHRAPRYWDGDWTLVIIPDDLPAERRTVLGQRLSWLGFGRFGGSTFAHPTCPLAPVVELLDDLGAAGEVILLRARHPAVGAAPSNEDLARRCSDLDAVESSYREVHDRFRPVLLAAEGGRLSGPTDAVLVRTLLRDAYRRVLLRDPQLPDALLPAGWAGDVTHRTVAGLYRHITVAADRHLERVGQTVDGALPPLHAAYRDRFLD
jgi:phenylacetic acid degradation operon negative regulatory protein